MIAIPIQISPTHYNLVFVLEDTNLQRIKDHDPAVYECAKMKVEPYKSLTLGDIAIAYATPEEMEKIQAMHQDLPGIMKILLKGWAYRPNLGDHDGTEYQKIGFN